MNPAAAALLLLFAACPASDPDGAWLAPAAGQTRVARDLALVVHTNQLRVPPDYPLEDLIQVVDLESGGVVPGTVTYSAGELRFEPRLGWGVDRRYAWSVLPVEALPHAPEVHVETALIGAQAFDTSERLDGLAAARLSDTEACVVLSRPPEAGDEGTIRITLNGVDGAAVTARVAPRAEWGSDLELTAPDLGLGVWCLSFAPDVPTGGDTGAPPPDPSDTGLPPEDTGLPPGDTGTADTGAPPPDTGAPDTGAPDTGTPPPDTGDTGSADTGSDTGSVANTFTAGDELRVWWGDAGPWRLTLEDAAVRDVVGRLHREVAP